jgi:Tol biopolymer transport system component
MVVDGREGEGFGNVKSPVFSPDGAHLAYQALAGDRWLLVVDGTVHPGTPKGYLTHGFSSDGSRIAFIDDQERGRLVVADTAFKSQTVIDPAVSQMQWSGDRARLAAIGADGARQRVLTFGFDKVAAVTRGPSEDSVDGVVFGPDGLSVAYIAERSGKRYVVLDGREEPLFSDVIGPLVIHPSGRALGALLNSTRGAVFHQFFDLGATEPGYEEAEGLTYSGDGRSHAYAARKGESWFIVVNGKEGPPFDRVVSPIFSPDGKLVVYRARKDGKRFVVVADSNGKIVRLHPSYEQVFPLRFTADGKSVAYGVKDGRQLWWKVEPL